MAKLSSEIRSTLSIQLEEVIAKLEREVLTQRQQWLGKVLEQQPDLTR